MYPARVSMCRAASTWEVPEGVAELVYVEFESQSVAGSCGYLVEIGEMFVYLFNIVFIRKIVADAFRELGHVSIVAQ